MPNIKAALPKGLKDRLWPYYVRLFGHTDYQRFAIVGHARTGSNFMHAGLASSDSVRMYHEIFAAHKREIGRDFDKIFSKLFQKQHRDTTAVGFKVFYYHLTEAEWTRLLSQTAFRFIHLTRVNRLRTIVSLDLAFQTDAWQTRDVRKQAGRATVTLDPDKLIERIETIEAYERSMRKRLSGHGTIEVEYETLVADPVSTLGKVSEFLGVQGTDPGRIPIRRQNPEHLSVLIENYDAVAECLATTRFSAYLE